MASPWSMEDNSLSASENDTFMNEGWTITRLIHSESRDQQKKKLK